MPTRLIQKLKKTVHISSPSTAKAIHDFGGLLAIVAVFLGVSLFTYVTGLQDQYQKAVSALDGIEGQFRNAIDANTSLTRTISKSGAAVVMTDFNGNVLQWSDGATEMFGYEQVEMIGRTVETIIPDDLKDVHTEAFKRMTRQPFKRIHLVRCNALTKTGETIPIENNVFMSEDDNRVVSVIIRASNLINPADFE